MRLFRERAGVISPGPCYLLNGSQELYILSYKMGRLTGKQLQYAPYNALSGQQSGPWKNVPANMIKKFEKVYEQ